MPWFEFEARRQGDLIYEAFREDPVKPYSFEQHEAARAHMINVAQTRAAYVQQQLSSVADPSPTVTRHIVCPALVRSAGSRGNLAKS